jgi:cell division protein FtsI (penicillin-binding protein 3)
VTDLAARAWRGQRARKPGGAWRASRRTTPRDAAKPLEVARSRLVIAGVVFALGFVALGIKVIGLSLNSDMATQRPSASQSETALSLARADIVDRNGNLLATDLPTTSLYIDQTQILDPVEAADQLRTVLPELDRGGLIDRTSGSNHFVWLKRNLTPEQQYQINRLGVPGFGFQREEKRVYPFGPLFAHALGVTGIDNYGLSGIEHALNTRLAGDGKTSGAPLQLALDLRVQHALTEELLSSIEAFQAVGGAGLVMDATNGEILALASLPSFDPNGVRAPNDEEMFNRVTLGVYELGSTFKSFTVAMALDYGVVDLSSGYDASQPIHIGRFTIRDDHPRNRWLTVPEIFTYSSNIGAAKIALDVGGTRQRAFLGRLGMFDTVPLELPELGHPLVPKQWQEINTMTIAFGHGIAVTPLHLARGFAALVNGGILPEPTLLRRAPGEPVPGKRVIKAETSDVMRQLLRQVVTDGTGKKAAAPGYLIGGKTGTAEKVALGGYRKNSLLTVFIGAFPMNAPKYVVLTMLDEPKGNKASFGFATAGWTAAPVVGRVVSRVAPLLGVEPVDEDAPPSHEELLVQNPPSGAKLAAY